MELLPTPESGTAKGEFFHKDENPFQTLDAAHPPTVQEEDEDELETSVQPPLIRTRLIHRICILKL